MTLNIWFALSLLLALNLIAFLAQGLDKHLARTGGRRIPERRLLELGALLAAPGMWLGMRVFRHKTSKGQFLLGAWIVTALDLALVWALYELWRREWLTFSA